jgi:hypothetical protein
MSREKINKYPRPKTFENLPRISDLRPKKKEGIVNGLTAALNYWRGFLQRHPDDEKALKRIDTITSFLKKRSKYHKKDGSG